MLYSVESHRKAPGLAWDEWSIGRLSGRVMPKICPNDQKSEGNWVGRRRVSQREERARVEWLREERPVPPHEGVGSRAPVSQTWKILSATRMICALSWGWWKTQKPVFPVTCGSVWSGSCDLLPSPTTFTAYPSLPCLLQLLSWDAPLLP